MKQSRHANGKLALLRGTNFNSLYSLLFSPGIPLRRILRRIPAMPARPFLLVQHAFLAYRMKARMDGGRAAGKIAFTPRYYRLFDIQSAIIITQPDIGLKMFTRENSASRVHYRVIKFIV